MWGKASYKQFIHMKAKCWCSSSKISSRIKNAAGYPKFVSFDKRAEMATSEPEKARVSERLRVQEELLSHWRQQYQAMYRLWSPRARSPMHTGGVRLTRHPKRGALHAAPRAPQKLFGVILNQQSQPLRQQAAQREKFKSVKIGLYFKIWNR